MHSPSYKVAAVICLLAAMPMFIVKSRLFHGAREYAKAEVGSEGAADDDAVEDVVQPGKQAPCSDDPKEKGKITLNIAEDGSSSTANERAPIGPAAVEQRTPNPKFVEDAPIADDTAPIETSAVEQSTPNPKFIEDEDAPIADDTAVIEIEEDELSVFNGSSFTKSDPKEESTPNPKFAEEESTPNPKFAEDIPIKDEESTPNPKFVEDGPLADDMATLKIDEEDMLDISPVGASVTEKGTFEFNADIPSAGDTNHLGFQDGQVPMFNQSFAVGASTIQESTPNPKLDEDTRVEDGKNVLQLDEDEFLVISEAPSAGAQ